MIAASVVMPMTVSLLKSSVAVHARKYRRAFYRWMLRGINAAVHDSLRRPGFDFIIENRRLAASEAQPNGAARGKTMKGKFHSSPMSVPAIKQILQQ